MRTDLGPFLNAANASPAASNFGSTLDRFSALELSVCHTCHEAVGDRVRKSFAWISRLGDGHYVYATLLGLLLAHGTAAVGAIVHVLVVALVGHILYRTLKSRTARVRPLDLATERFRGTVPPLDKYSFPSGHTLHAVTFAITASTFFPALAWLLAPFAVLVAASRVVLGLHYPTDVFAGAALGTGLAVASFQL